MDVWIVGAPDSPYTRSSADPRSPYNLDSHPCKFAVWFLSHKGAVCAHKSARDTTVRVALPVALSCVKQQAWTSGHHIFLSGRAFPLNISWCVRQSHCPRIPFDVTKPAENVGHDVGLILSQPWKVRLVAQDVVIDRDRNHWRVRPLQSGTSNYEVTGAVLVATHTHWIRAG